MTAIKKQEEKKSSDLFTNELVVVWMEFTHIHTEMSWEQATVSIQRGSKPLLMKMPAQKNQHIDTLVRHSQKALKRQLSCWVEQKTFARSVQSRIDCRLNQRFTNRYTVFSVVILPLRTTIHLNNNFNSQISNDFGEKFHSIVV